MGPKEIALNVVIMLALLGVVVAMNVRWDAGWSRSGSGAGSLELYRKD